MKLPQDNAGSGIRTRTPIARKGILSPFPQGRIGALLSYIVVRPTRQKPRNSTTSATNSATVRHGALGVAPDRAYLIALAGWHAVLAHWAVLAIALGFVIGLELGR